MALEKDRHPGPHNAHKGTPVNILTFWKGLCKHKQSGPWVPPSLAGCWGPFRWNQTKKAPQPLRIILPPFPQLKIGRWGGEQDPQRKRHLPKITPQKKGKNQSLQSPRSGASGPAGSEPPSFLPQPCCPGGTGLRHCRAFP